MNDTRSYFKVELVIISQFLLPPLPYLEILMHKIFIFGSFYTLWFCVETTINLPLVILYTHVNHIFGVLEGSIENVCQENREGVCVGGGLGLILGEKVVKIVFLESAHVLR